MPCPVCFGEHDTTACPPAPIPVPEYGGRDYQATTPQYGWECPKCHGVMAPFQLSCIHCLPLSVTFTVAPSPGD